MMLARLARKQLALPIVLTYHTKFDIDSKAPTTKALRNALTRFILNNVRAADEVFGGKPRGAGESLIRLATRASLGGGKMARF